MSNNANEYDGLKVTVSEATTGNSSKGYPKIEVEEDTFHLATLVEIRQSQQTYKGTTTPCWLWVYELESPNYYVDGKKLRVYEKTSKKLTPAPYTSRAYQRYVELTGKEPTIGETIDLRKLFGVKCKLMIKNTIVKTKDGEQIYHKIEKVSIKGVKELANKTQETSTNPVESNEPTNEMFPPTVDDSPASSNNSDLLTPDPNADSSEDSGDLFENLF